MIVETFWFEPMIGDVLQAQTFQTSGIWLGAGWTPLHVASCMGRQATARIMQIDCGHTVFPSLAKGMLKH